MGFRAIPFLLLAICCSFAYAEDGVFGSSKLQNLISEVTIKNDFLCEVCENFTSEAVNYLREKKTHAEITEALHSACSEIKSFEEECVSLVDYYANLFFLEVDKISPAEFCTKFSLCKTTSLNLLPKDGSTCTFCRHVVEEILAKLKDPDSQLEIIEVLLKECNVLESYVQQCKRAVLQYAPLILINGAKFLEKNDICMEIRACEASKSQSFPEFTGSSHPDA